MSELPPAQLASHGGDDVNERAKRHQMIVWAVIVTVLAVPVCYFGWQELAPPAARTAQADAARHNAATAAAASSINQLSPVDQAASQYREEKAALEEAQRRNLDLQQQLTEAQDQAQSDRADATHTLKVLSQNMGMRSGSDPGAVGDPAEVTSPGAQPAQMLARLQPIGGLVRRPARKDVTQALAAGEPDGALASPHRTLQTVNIAGQTGGPGSQIGGVSTVPNDPSKSSPTVAKGGFITSKFETFESARFVPPNAYVEAKVLVGVDAATGTSYSADPKPVLFRLIGPATHVGIDGKFQTTDLTGCLVNGAAFGELPSEKVYIKLQKITCPAGVGRFSVATIEGYASSKGKAGVRGQVISREGQFTGRAMVAGLLNGLGAGLSKNVQASQGGLTTSVTGTGDLAAHQLTASQIATGSLGTGVSQASSMLADYYIKRAEQYQPVIEMPTGIQVELVFLSGFEIQ